MERNRRRRAEQRTECLRSRRGPLPGKFLVIVNKRGQKKTAKALQRHSAHWESIQKIS